MDATDCYYRSLGDRVISVMEQRRPYLEKAFGVRDLAGLLEVPVHHVHHCFKYVLKTRFIALRTAYRVGHAKKLLLEADMGNTTLEAIGWECGFATRPHFYRVFCQEVGCSPGAYIGRSRKVMNVVG